jgi:hypothetical protein
MSTNSNVVVDGVDELNTAMQSQMALSTTAATATEKGDDGVTDVNGGNEYDRWSLLDDSTVEYGYLSKTGGKGIQDETNSSKGFYLTTAINYTNGPAHMGHAYEGTTSDVISRYHRLKGTQPCYFVTGADEHGQKIATTAEGEGKAPQEICDKVSNSSCIVLYCIYRIYGALSSVRAVSSVGENIVVFDSDYHRSDDFFDVLMKVRDRLSKSESTDAYFE